MKTILVVDDEENIRTILSAMLKKDGYEVLLAKDLKEAMGYLSKNPVNCVLTDLRLKAEDGMTLLEWVKAKRLPTPVVMLTAHGSIDSAVDAMKQGAFDYLSKPFEQKELLGVIRKAILTFQFHSFTYGRPQGKPSNGFPMIGNNKKMLEIFELTEKIASTDSTVMISGESGTGKELIAQAIHEKSNRRQAAFIKINCSAIPHSLMESELFGYERGAFTGAINSKPGRFELADQGTLFLDEVGEMSVEMQVKLLRVLQDGYFERVGGIRTLKSNVRLITATNKDLKEEVAEGRFREDLYYRLNVVPIHLPPLKDRPDDIPLLVAHCVNRFSERLERPVPNVDPDCLKYLVQYPWPGNIRQLENVIERMMVMNQASALLPSMLPQEVLDCGIDEEDYESDGSLKSRVKQATKRIERQAIEEALLASDNNVTQAAKSLNISRKGLQIKMKELGFRSNT